MSKERVDLVLADFAMPDMFGWSLPWRLIEEFPHTLIGMITNAREAKFMQAMLGDTFDFMLVKPFEPRELKNKVRYHLDQQRRS